MDSGQLIVFGVLTVTLVLFTWNRWRYDIVAVMALLVVALAGLVPAEEVFSGFGHPAVITVAAVLVLSRGLLNAGVVDSIARLLTKVGDRPWVQVATLTGIVALCSGFINNVGALALLMPVAIWMSRKSNRSPSLLLMPLAFGSLLGGTLTLIGTPPNIIIASYRRETGVEPFGMFDFLPVGLGVTVVGILFISLIGWRLTPKRNNENESDSLFEISDYLAEVFVPEDSKFVGKSIHELLEAVKEDSDVVLIALIRMKNRMDMPSTYNILQAGDVLSIEADTDSLKSFLDVSGLKLSDETVKDTEEEEADQKNKKLTLVEAIVSPKSRLIGSSPSRLDLRERYGVNLLAVARQGHRLKARLSKIKFVAGDILLLQGGEDGLTSKISTLGCLPLASRGLRIGKPRKMLLASLIFGTALTAIAFSLVSVATALVAAAVVMVLTRLVDPKEIYESIDLPVIVLLAAMLPIGKAMETTGGSQLIANGLLLIGNSAALWVTLGILMIAVMMLSNIINNAAAAVLAAPVAINLARGMDVSADPFLMAVAIGSSCAFLTPIGHQSNTLVMTPGGYRFGDYWRMGLPLSILVVVISIPLILLVF